MSMPQVVEPDARQFGILRHAVEALGGNVGVEGRAVLLVKTRPVSSHSPSKAMRSSSWTRRHSFSTDTVDVDTASAAIGFGRGYDHTPLTAAPLSIGA